MEGRKKVEITKESEDKRKKGGMTKGGKEDRSRD